jgi:hypothetical protein
VRRRGWRCRVRGRWVWLFRPLSWCYGCLKMDRWIGDFADRIVVLTWVWNGVGLDWDGWRGIERFRVSWERFGLDGKERT